jgi:hypothetical protein
MVKPTQQLSDRQLEFIILRNNSDRKCSVCGVIEQIMYVSEQVFCSRCCPANCKLHKKKPNRAPGKIVSLFNADKLRDLYYHQQKSLQDIASEYNCSRQMVKSLMEKYGLQRRKRSKARVLAIKKGKFANFEYDDIDEEFFSKWAPQMAWILGLLFTDGCLSKNGASFRVSISSKDYELLEKIKLHLNSKKQIDIDVQSYDSTKYIYRFEFYREKMMGDLQQIGLSQRKSLNMKFPDMPEDCKRHFIRGCWDGDGTVYLSSGKIEAKYVSGSKEFITSLVDELFKVGISRSRTCFISNDDLSKLKQTHGLGKYPLRIYEDYRSKAISYSIKLNSRDNIEKLFHYFYEGVDEASYLTRKYNVFQKGIGLG